MKKLLTVILAIVLIISLLTACGSSDNGSNNKESIDNTTSRYPSEKIKQDAETVLYELTKKAFGYPLDGDAIDVNLSIDALIGDKTYTNINPYKFYEDNLSDSESNFSVLLTDTVEYIIFNGELTDKYNKLDDYTKRQVKPSSDIGWSMDFYKYNKSLVGLVSLKNFYLYSTEHYPIHV